MRAIQHQQEFGGPEVLELVDLPVPEPGDGEVLIRVSRAGMNFADTHQRDERLPGGRTSCRWCPAARSPGVREDTGRARGRAERHRRLRRVRDGARGADLPDPRRRRRRHRAGAAHPGADRLAPVPHLRRASAAGESVVVAAAAGGVGSLAVQLGKPMGAGRVIAHGLDRGEARRSRSSSAPTPRSTPTPTGLKERLVEANGGRAGRRRLRDGGRRGVRRSRCAALAPFGRLVTYGIASRRAATRSARGSLMRRSRAVVGFWLDALPRAPGDDRRGRWPTSSRAPRAASCAPSSARPTRSSDARAGPGRPRRAPHDGQGPARPEQITGSHLVSCT